MIKLTELLEKSLGHFKQEYKLVVFIDKTKHAELRQSRHEGETISDDVIKEAVLTASKEIINMLVFDKIDIGDIILVHRKRDNLNIVGAVLREGSSNVLRFEVITVMKSSEFRNVKNTPIINIK